MENRSRSRPTYEILNFKNGIETAGGLRARIEVIGRITGEIRTLYFVTNKFNIDTARKATEKAIDVNFPGTT